MGAWLNFVIRIAANAALASLILLLVLLGQAKTHTFTKEGGVVEDWSHAGYCKPALDGFGEWFLSIRCGPARP